MCIFLVAIGCELVFEPFRCFALTNFVKIAANQAEFFCQLRQECRRLRYFKKNNDLYKFKQSDDLAKLKIGPHLTKLTQFLKNQLKPWLGEVTGIELNDRMAATVSSYGHTDVLLCHDDELENRRIAFVLYLSENWLPEFGGSLDLFTVDSSNRPVSLVKRIVPRENMLSFFEVLPNSFHQVAEVVGEEEKRVSVNGWFFGDPIERPKVVPEKSGILRSPGFVEYEIVVTWINPEYLDPKVQMEIRRRFEDESQIELQNFLQSDKYAAVFDELSGESVEWKLKTPYNQRFYDVLDDETLKKPNLSTLFELMSSEAMFLLFSQLTGLKLHPLFVDDDDDEPNNECGSSKVVDEQDEGPTCSKKIRMDNGDPEKAGKMTAKCEMELRKFTHRCYTLMHDEESSENEFALDAQLFFTNNAWKTEHGGYSCYVAKGEDEELLTVVPKRNSLALVYRGGDTLKFVKYINAKAKDKEFCDLNMVLFEK